MNFFVDPAFFVLLVPIVGIAACLGMTQRPLRRYGSVVSLLMLLLLFYRTPEGLALCAGYIAMSLVLARWVLSLFAKKDHDQNRAVLLYRVALALQIAPLIIYKVTVAAGGGLLGFLGISYITFKGAQVLIEIRDGLITELSATDYLYFLTFFPTFTSGPILRSRTFVADVHKELTRDDYLDRLYRGLGWLVMGAVYKFVGGALAQWATWFLPSLIGTSTPFTFGVTQVVSCVTYGVYEFFDFAGYSYMAMGVGLCLGVEVMRNFNKPFLSLDLKDFWTRWHISLSTWVRDFVFMRFVQTSMEHKWFKSRLTTACVGYMINMVLIGLWHGITLDYFVYGVFYGLCMAGVEFYQKRWKFYKKHRRDKWFQVCEWAVNMVVVFMGFALFNGQLFHPVIV
ncbi:MAG: D-alanyl-lipoteichoic acid biosynthesis protein DltB [Coriobacteriales bacterium]|nr:D-alanyl-lipoteichoic acid biosynthesis protein DltB [Coriobacteriales bacterium]